MPSTAGFYNNDLIRYYRGMDLLYQKMMLERWTRKGSAEDLASLNEGQLTGIRQEIDNIQARAKSDEFNYLGKNYNYHVIVSPLDWIENKLESEVDEIPHVSREMNRELIGNLISAPEIQPTEVEGLIQGFKSFARASDFLWRPGPP
jgi:hypothetical protein